jgi:hypothetical protein
MRSNLHKLIDSQQEPASDEQIHKLATELYKTKRKALVDINELHDNVVKQGVIKYADAKYLTKGK